MSPPPTAVAGVAARRPHDRRRRWPALAAIAVGALSCAAAVAVWPGKPVAPYRYVMGAPVAPVDLGPLAALAERQIPVRAASVVAGDGSTLADLEVAESADGPVLLQWRSRVDEPFLKVPVSREDIANLAPVLERHVADDAKLLAWWDSSRELRLLSGVNVVFGEPIGSPLFIPDGWRHARTGIESVETDFWRTRADAVQQARFDRFVDALLADEAQGMAMLRELAGAQPTVLALNSRDVVLLAHLAPERIGIALQDFPAGGDVHGMVRSAHAWLGEHGYTAYTLIHMDDQRLRVVALTDARSGNTLVARLLPFIGNKQDTVAGTTLVYQTGAFWIYEIGDDPGTAGVAAAATATATATAG